MPWNSKVVKNYFLIFLLATLSISGFYIYSHIDIPIYNIPWSVQIADAHLNIYSNSISPKVDYPPIIPLVFGIVGEIIKLLTHFLGLSNSAIYFLQNGLLKLPSILTFILFLKLLPMNKILGGGGG